MKLPTDGVASESKNSSINVSRRAILSAIPAAAGFAATGVNASSSSGNQSVEIVTLRKGDGTPEKKAKVPKKWLKHEEKATQVAEELKNRYMNKDWVESVGLGEPKSKVAGKPASELVINIDTSSEKGKKKIRGTKKDIPSNFDGISVHTRGIKKTKPVSCYHSGDYSQVWGGEICGRGPNGGYGTAGYYVWKNGNRYLLHANHVFGGNDACTNPDGMAVYQGGSYLGEVIGHHQSHDWVVIEDRSGPTSFDPDPTIWVGDNGVNVHSWVTQSGLRQFKSNNTPVYKQGVKTGLTSGTINGHSLNRGKGCITIANGVEISANCSGGDSGGPMFMTYNGGSRVGMIAMTSLGIDWPPDLGTTCDGDGISANTFGHPTWRFIEQDYGGQYTLDTSG